MASCSSQLLMAALQAAAGPEQTPGAVVHLQRHPTVGAGVIANQLRSLGQAPAAAFGDGRGGMQQQTPLGITAVAADHLQRKDIDDLHPTMQAWLAGCGDQNSRAPRTLLMQASVSRLTGMAWPP